MDIQGEITNVEAEQSDKGMGDVMQVINPIQCNTPNLKFPDLDCNGKPIKPIKPQKQEFTVGVLGKAPYVEKPSLARIMANFHKIPVNDLQEIYEDIKKKQSKLSRRERDLVVFKMMEYSKLGVVKL